MELVISIVITFICVIIIAFIINLFNDGAIKNKSIMSLKESLDLARIPIITFKEGNVKLNFLVDTGATDSHIRNSIVSKLVGKTMDTHYNYTNSTGSVDTNCKMIETTLKYKKDEFKVNLFTSEDLDSSFDELKKECGVIIHGILGLDFLEKYKYIIDFNKLVIYRK